MDRDLERAIKLADYIGAAAGVIGASLIALNIGLGMWGYIVFIVSSTLYTWVGWKTKRKGLMIMNVIFFAINLLGVFRFFQINKYMDIILSGIKWSIGLIGAAVFGLSSGMAYVNLGPPNWIPASRVYVSEYVNTRDQIAQLSQQIETNVMVLERGVLSPDDEADVQRSLIAQRTELALLQNKFTD